MNIKDVTSNEQQICCRCKNTASDNKIRFDCCHNTCLINISTQCFSENVFKKIKAQKMSLILIVQTHQHDNTK